MKIKAKLNLIWILVSSEILVLNFLIGLQFIKNLVLFVKYLT